MKRDKLIVLASIVLGLMSLAETGSLLLAATVSLLFISVFGD